ncbi:hypothetical protein ACP70R_007996 [Stipagrostis hirtigluma subsp. patula]
MASKAGTVLLCFLLASLLLFSSIVAAAEPEANTYDPGRKTMKAAAAGGGAVAAEQDADSDANTLDPPKYGGSPYTP